MSLKPIGKIGKRNIDANKKIKEQLEAKSIRSCEVCPVLFSLGRLKVPCLGSMFMSFAHRNKRIWYRSRPEMLYDFGQFALACQNGHNTIEYDKELTEQVFVVLRGKE